MTHSADPGPGPASHRHAGHDPLLIARYATGDADASEVHAASDLIAGCAACAALATDVQVLRAAMAAPPSMPRRRDFRLTPAQAADLRQPSLLGRLRAWRMPQLAWLQPLAGAVAAASLVMAVLTSGVGIAGLGGTSTGGRAPLSAAGPAVTQAAPGAAAAAPSAASPAPLLGAAPAPSAASVAASAAPPAIAAAPASPGPTPPTPAGDMIGASPTGASPPPGASPAAVGAPGATQPAASATPGPEAVLARPAAASPTVGEQVGAATSRGGVGGAAQAPAAWALWLALAVVCGVAFLGLRRASRTRI